MKRWKKIRSCLSHGVRQNNKGFTMVEFIVICSIMAVILSVAGMSMAIKPSSEAKQAASSIDSLLSRCKMGVLTKTGNVYMEINSDAKGVISLRYYEDSRLISTETVTSGGVTVSYSLEGSSGTTKTLARTESLYLSFDRRSGGYVTLKSAFSMASKTYSGGDTDKCEYIYVNGGPTGQHVKLGVVTGSHTLNG